MVDHVKKRKTRASRIEERDGRAAEMRRKQREQKAREAAHAQLQDDDTREAD
jgi:hypothetical protein